MSLENLETHISSGRIVICGEGCCALRFERKILLEWVLELDLHEPSCAVTAEHEPEPCDCKAALLKQRIGESLG